MAGSEMPEPSQETSGKSVQNDAPGSANPGTRPSRSVDEILKDLRSPNSELREFAVHEACLGRVSEAIPLIEEISEGEPDPEFRYFARKALSMLQRALTRGPALAVPATVQGLIEGLSHPSPEFRAQCIATLIRQRGTDPLPHLVDLMASENHQTVRAVLVKALGVVATKDDKDVVQLMVKILLTDKNPRVRANAIEVLGQLEAKSALAAITLGLKDNDHRVQSAAALVLSKWDDSILFKTAETMIKGGKNNFIDAAAFALAQSGDARAIPLLGSILVSKCDSAKAKAVKALIAHASRGNTDATKILGDNALEILASPDGDSDEAQQILRILDANAEVPQRPSRDGAFASQPQEHIYEERPLEAPAPRSSKSNRVDPVALCAKEDPPEVTLGPHSRSLQEVPGENQQAPPSRNSTKVSLVCPTCGETFLNHAGLETHRERCETKAKQRQDRQSFVGATVKAVTSMFRSYECPKCGGRYRSIEDGCPTCHFKNMPWTIYLTSWCLLLAGGLIITSVAWDWPVHERLSHQITHFHWVLWGSAALWLGWGFMRSRNWAYIMVFSSSLVTGSVIVLATAAVYLFPLNCPRALAVLVPFADPLRSFGAGGGLVLFALLIAETKSWIHFKANWGLVSLLSAGVSIVLLLAPLMQLYRALNLVP